MMNVNRIKNEREDGFQSESWSWFTVSLHKSQDIESQINLIII